MLATPSLNGHALTNGFHAPEPRFTVPSPNGDNGPPAPPEPSPNGDNGHPAVGGAPSPNGDNGRDSHGRFAKGNRGGPGNPFARRVARLRTLLLELVSEDDLRGILGRMVEKARAGDLTAARLLLSYLVGRPVDAVDPDRLDLDEWRLYQECPKLGEVVDSQQGRMEPHLASHHARACQQKITNQIADKLRERREQAEE